MRQTFTVFDVPNSNDTEPTAINPAGEVTGWYGDANSCGLGDAVTESVPSALPRTLLHATVRMLGSHEPDRH
jgi:hypothetical protein